MSPASSGHIVLCGLDELGFRTLEELRRLGEEVVVVERAPGKGFARRARELGARIVVGDYRDDAVLREADIDRAAAMVIVEDDDVGNLHAALTAQELNGELRIGLRMFNEDLGRRVEELFRDCLVLDPASIVAPAFVAAALHQEAEQRLDVAGTPLVVRKGAADDPGVVLPLARLSPDGSAELFPTSGEDVLCLARPAERDAGQAIKELRRLRKRVQPRGLLASLAFHARTMDRRLGVLAAILLGLIVFSIAVFSSAKGLGLIDAIYFTITIITTTGFGDINLLTEPAPLKLYGVVLMLLGAAVLAIFFALVTDVVVGARLARALGGIPRRLRGHVVVCGLGNIGYRVVEELVSAEVPVVAAEANDDARFLPAARALGVPVLIADARLPETLQALSVADAECLIVVTNDDLANLETALNARSLSPNLRVVLRLFDDDLARRVQRAFGIHISRSPSALAAPAFAASAEGRRVLATVPAGTSSLIVAETRVEHGSRAREMTVDALEDATGARVLLLVRNGAETWRPPATTELAFRDELVVVATRGALEEVVAVTEEAAVTLGGQRREEAGRAATWAPQSSSGS